MDAHATVVLNTRKGFVAFAGAGISRILSAELVAKETLGNEKLPLAQLSAICHDRWADLASGIAALPTPIEAYLVADNGQAFNATMPNGRITFLAAGRGQSESQALEVCDRTLNELWKLLVTTIDFIGLRLLADQNYLRSVAENLVKPHVTEISRRLERIPVGQSEEVVMEMLGFLSRRTFRAGGVEALTIEHLFPWVPTDDPWRRLLECLAEEDGARALVVHVQGHRQVPRRSRMSAVKSLDEIQRLVEGPASKDGSTQSVAKRMLAALQEESLGRMAILNGSTLAARVFFTGDGQPTEALLATAVHSFDDAFAHKGQTHANSLFRGGANLKVRKSEEVLAPLNTPSLKQIFGTREVTAIWRTPMPTDDDLPGIPVNRARTFPLRGQSGDDCYLGDNIHRERRVPVMMEEQARFRHTYIVGQTGTGKSTLMMRMALHDIKAGRGVCVLDPHGSLIDDILLRFPPERQNDVVVLDVSDVERPVGFNIMRIDEPDPRRYRFARDLLIDELLGYMQRTYLADTMGPIFETHFRGMLGVLLGVEPPVPPLRPNLMVFRALYVNSALRKALAKKLEGRDFVLQTFLEEAVAATGEAQLANMAQYITSKLNRFITDEAVRNIICQRSILDIEKIVNEGKVLLVYLGKGRIGDIAAGLIASQVVSRIRSEVMRRGPGKARPFYLHADEFQLFADDRFGELLAEARKFGLSLTLAHQFAKQLPPRVLEAVIGNVGTVLAFRLGSADGERLEPLFAPRLGRLDLGALPNYRAYVRASGKLGLDPFSLETTMPFDAIDPVRAAEIRKASRDRYGTDCLQVEKEIREDYLAYTNRVEE